MDISNLFASQKITAEVFLQRYWQKRPYLFQKTDLDLSCLPNQQQLFELAAEEDVQSRIIYSEDGQAFRALYDEPEAWKDVIDHHPTLLVSDIEKWYPKAQKLLKAFPFIKSWRLDDLMISFAPTGASVGAHTDHYDVFLIQMAGSRIWSWDDEPLCQLQPQSQPQLVEDSDLSVLANYQAKNTFELKPGDILYLPPEIAHHGVSSSEDCMTCSIGMRAPSQSEMVMAFAEFISERCDDKSRFTDQGTWGSGKLASGRHSFDDHDVNRFKQSIQNACSLGQQEWQQLFGKFFSDYRQLEQFTESFPDHCGNWKKNPLNTFTYTRKNNAEDAAILFIDGEHFDCPWSLAIEICQSDVINHSEEPIILDLIDAGYLIPLTDTID